MNSERMEGILSLIPKSEIIIDVGTESNRNRNQSKTFFKS